MGDAYDDMDAGRTPTLDEWRRRALRAEPVVAAAAAILRPARGDASWLHTVEFDDLRSALIVALGPEE